MKMCETCKWYLPAIVKETTMNASGSFGAVSRMTIRQSTCTLNPKHIEVTPNHFCGQWETPNE